MDAKYTILTKIGYNEINGKIRSLSGMELAIRS
jgi:hypothetical protein